MEPGPALAGWLEVAAGGATSLNEYGLTGLVIAARKQAAHAQGVELTAVAQITSRAAAADRRVGVSSEGRPARVCRDAAGQVEMALRLSHDGAHAWADLPPPDELPPPPDEPLPADGEGDGLDDTGDAADAGGDFDPWEDDDDLDGTGPPSAWPALGSLPPGLARAVPADGTPPAAGLLDVTLPWVTPAGLADRPGTLGRIGAITPAQARQLALAAASDPAAQWRVIVTSPDGHAVAVARIRRRARRARDPSRSTARDGPPARPGPAGRVTLTIGQDTIAALVRGGAGPPSGTGLPDGILAAALRTAERALRRALVQAEADAAAGGCAHTAASAAYRPPPRLREYVIARDLTCRNPVCRQPAWRADLDHTIPWEEGGPTCSCNLSGECRRDHQLKQHPRWKLAQVKPGWFEWTAPSGRTYITQPATYIA